MYRLLSTIGILILSTATHALPTDSKEKVYIESESAIYNYKTGTDIYEGNVKVKQGTTHITADKLVTKKNSDHKISEAVAYGYTQLAHFWTLPKADEAIIHAQAKIIKFFPIKSNAVLENDVFVTQGQNSFKGDMVQYDNAEQTITVPPSKNGRAVIIYNPEKA